MDILFGPFVIDNVWLQCKRSNKIHVLLFVTNFHVPIIVSFNHWATHQPHQPNQCQHRSTWGIKAKCNNLPRDLKPFCLFVFIFVFCFLFCFVFFVFLLVSFASFPSSRAVQKSFPPLPDPFLKLDPRLYNILLRHCICIMYRKHRIRWKAVGLLEI